jgi:hypothetical protein
MAVLSSSPSAGHPAVLASGTRWASPGGLLAVACGAALCASAALEPSEVRAGPVVCPFRMVTGLPCPGCGMTRAWVLLAHGRPDAAMLANPFVLLVMPAAVLWVLVTLSALVRRRPAPDPAKLMRSAALRTVACGWLAFAVVRLIAVLTGHASV